MFCSFSNCTPLHFATCFGGSRSIDVCRALISGRANVAARDMCDAIDSTCCECSSRCSPLTRLLAGTARLSSNAPWLATHPTWRNILPALALLMNERVLRGMAVRCRSTMMLLKRVVVVAAIIKLYKSDRSYGMLVLSFRGWQWLQGCFVGHEQPPEKTIITFDVRCADPRFEMRAKMRAQAAVQYQADAKRFAGCRCQDCARRRCCRQKKESACDECRTFSPSISPLRFTTSPLGWGCYVTSPP
jgi:hypothetical protein